MKNLKNFVPPLLACLVLGVLFLIIAGPGAFLSFSGPKELSTLNVEHLENAYVTAELDFFVDEYAYTTKKNTYNNSNMIMQMEFIIPVGVQEYIAVTVDDEILQAAKLWDASKQVLSGDADSIPPDLAPIRVTGTILPMTEPVLESYRASYLSGALGADADRMLPLILRSGYVGTHPGDLVSGMTALASIMFFVVTVCLALVLIGPFYGQVPRFCRESGDAAGTMRRLEDFYRDTEPYNGVRFGPEFMMFHSGLRPIAVRTEDVLWAYLHTTVRGFVSGQELVLCTRDQKRYAVLLYRRKTVAATLEYIGKIMPHTVLGYNERLNLMFIRHPDQFARIPYDPELQAQVFDQ